MLRLLLCVLLFLAWAPVQATAQTPTDEKLKAQAEALHTRALAAAKARKWNDAIALWDTALSLHPVWKYAFNQALVYKHTSKWLLAWDHSRKAQRMGVPPEHAASVEKVLQAGEQKLLKAHVLLKLRTIPTNATVTLEGKPWAAPRERWVKRTSSSVEVSKAGFHTAKVTWSHPIGTRAEREIALESAPVVKPPDNPVEAPVTTPPKEPATVTKSPPSRVVPYTLLGSGLASLAGGAGMLGWAATIVSEAKDLNRKPPGDLADYNAQRDDLESNRKIAVYGGWALTAVGAAAVITSVVLFFTEKPQTNPEQSTGWTPLLWPGGAGALLRF